MWVPMLFIAIANGALRQFTFGRVMPELRAHQLSTIIGSVLIGSFIWFVISLFTDLKQACFFDWCYMAQPYSNF